jgi:hypothetical protein
VQLKLGTRHKKYSFHIMGRDRPENTGFSTQSAIKVVQKAQSCSDSDESHVSVGGLLVLGCVLRKKEKIKEEERQSMKCMKGT